MGNSFSGIPKKLEGVDPDRLTNEQNDYLHKLKERLQHESITKVAEILNRKVPNYFEQPKEKNITLPPMPGKAAPNSRLPENEGPKPPAAPSFAHLHPAADLLRRHLFLHIFSDQFRNAEVSREKLFVTGEAGEEDGKMNIAYIHMINGIHKRARLGTCPLSLDEISELQSTLPTLAKLRIVIKTSRTTSKTLEEHAKNLVPGPTLNATREYVRIMEIRAEVMGFDAMNRVVKPPGLVGVGARLFVVQEREMGQLVERKEWEWCVEQVREVCKAVIGPDGGVWEFMGAKCEEMAVEVEGEGVVNCFVVREE